MAKFRKKPVVIDAICYLGGQENVKEVFAWAHSFGTMPAIATNTSHNNLEIYTPNGVVQAKPGDWIIHGVAGEFYPCGSDIFAATHEAVVE